MGLVACTQEDMLMTGMNFLPYDRVDAVYAEGDDTRSHDAWPDHDRRILALPEHMLGSLATAVTLAREQRAIADADRSPERMQITYHSLARMLVGMEPSFEPLFRVGDAVQLPRGASLQAGEIGIIGDVDDPSGDPPHAVIGLGEDVPESLQFLWGDTIGICRNDYLFQYLAGLYGLHGHLALFRQDAA